MPITAQPTDVFQAPQSGGVPPPPPTPAPPPAAPPPVAPPGAPGSVPPPPVPPASAGVLSLFAGKQKLLLIIGGILLAVILLFVVFRVIASFSASGNNEENEKAELTYWGLYQDPRVMNVLIDEFQRENPNIKVTFAQQDAEQYRDRLVTRIRNGTGPDIFRFHNSWVPMLTGVLLPLSADAVTPADYEKLNYPFVKTDLVKNGGILGVPLSIDTLALFVNNEMFSSQRLAVPKNWDEFAVAAAALTTRDGEGSEQGKITTAGTALGTYDNITHASDIISLLLVQNGVDLKNISAAKKRETEIKCETLACGALQYYTIFSKGDSNIKKVWDGSLDPSVLSFANGRVGMYFGYSWDIMTIKGINPSLSYSIHPVPNLSGQKKTIASYWVEGVSGKTKYPKAAMKFMRFLQEKETQQKYFTENIKLTDFSPPYARTDLAPSLKDDERLYPFVEQAPYAVSTPFSSDTQDNGLNATLNGYLRNAIQEMTGNTSPESAITVLDSGVKQAFSQYGQ